MIFLFILLGIIMYSYFTSFKFEYEKYYDDSSIIFIFNILIYDRNKYKFILPKFYLNINLSYLGDFTIRINDNITSYQK